MCGLGAPLCDDSIVHQSKPAISLRRGHETDDESRLFDMVRGSARSVAVYDVSAPAILAASQRAREQCGFVDVELAEINIVDAATDTDSTRKLLTLIRDGQLKEWKVRSWLRTPAGGGSWEFASGQAIDIGGGASVSCPIPHQSHRPPTLTACPSTKTRSSTPSSAARSNRSPTTRPGNSPTIPLGTRSWISCTREGPMGSRISFPAGPIRPPRARPGGKRGSAHPSSPAAPKRAPAVEPARPAGRSSCRRPAGSVRA